MMIVTGTGRCGTGYMAECFRQRGIRAGHEAVFTPEGFKIPVNVMVESSWMAVPYLKHLNSPVVVVQRDPTECVVSLASQKGLFERPFSKYGEYLWKHCPGLTGSGYEAAAQFYLEWNERLEGYPRYKIEEVDVDEIIEDWGLRPTRDGETVSRRFNTRPKPQGVDLEKVLTAETFQRLSHVVYGYASY